MSYQETEATINKLRSHDEIMFRMAISHLMDVGIRNLTPENIEVTCNEIMKEDDSHSFMTNRYQCGLVRLAGELAKLDHIELLVYIQQNVEYAVYGDDARPVIPYRRMKEIATNALEEINSYPHMCDYRDFTDVLQEDVGMTPEEIEAFGYEFEDEEESD